MTLEQLFKCPRTIDKLTGGPLGGLMDGFCNALLERGFKPGTVRRHLSNVGHLNKYMDSKNHPQRQKLSAQTIKEFLQQYPQQARNRGPIDKHITAVNYSINRFISYLRTSDRFEPQVETSPYKPLLKAYLKWLEEQQHAAPGTINIRAHSISQFLQWRGPQATPQGCRSLTAEQVEDFFLINAHNKGSAAKRSMQAALRTFFRFCLQRGYIQQPLDRAVPRLRCYKLSTVARGLSDEQALKLLQSFDRSSHTGRRDYAICVLLYTYGVRGGQARALQLEDVDWVRNQIFFRAMKHGKDTLLPLTQTVGESLLDYLQNSRPGCQDTHLFLTLRAPYRALQSSSVLSNMINYYLQAANLQVACKGTHAFRHGFASRMLTQGHSLKAIADVLGHRHLSSTFIYTKIDFEHLQAVALPWPGEVLSCAH